MRQVRVHDDDEVSAGMLDAVDVGSPQAELLLPGRENNLVGTVNSLQALGNLVKGDKHFSLDGISC